MRTTITKPAPVTNPLSAINTIDELFANLLPGRAFAPFAPFAGPTPLPTSPTNWMPALDCVENDVNYIIRLDVPGIPKENLDLRLDAQLVTITGHREFVAANAPTETPFWMEREQGNFVRTIRLPVPVNAANVTATLVDGVMTIVLPKVTPTPTAKITIR
ncbi:MAG: Hsp20/alpha crystallin family protein [Gemmatimonadales bacterium]|nr:Hsp20/alpha crystallin family protein [Gemmatimonadales bacterium]